MLELKRAERAARSRRDLPRPRPARKAARGSASSSWSTSTSARSTPSTASPRAAASRGAGGQVEYARIADAREDSLRASSSRPRASAGHGSVPLQDQSRSSTCRTRSARSPPGRPTSASTRRPAPTSGASPRSRARRRPSATATCSCRIRRRRPTPTSMLLDNEPAHASMLRTSISPNILGGGYRVNVIPSEAKATLDVRMLPDEDPEKFLEAVRKIVERSGGRRPLRRARHAAPAARRAARFRSLQGGRSERHEALQHDDAAVDADRRDRHGLPAREGDAVLRHRPGDGHRGRAERASARTAIRSGCSRASCSVSSASTGTSPSTSRGQNDALGRGVIADCGLRIAD